MGLIFYFSLKAYQRFDYLLVFIAGLVNDTVVGLPLGLSSLSYILICIFASYLRNITISPNLMKDWFYFLFIIIKKVIDNIEIIKGDSIQNKKFEIPVCCEKEFSLDIKRLEEKLKMKEEKIYESFFEKEFFCYMTGFIAGMPFLGDLDENLRAKRLDTPRVKVPKGSIGLTEQFANIYTFESPGGWNIIGNTPLNIFDNTKEKEPNLINPGDLVTFKRISKEKYQNYHE